MSSRQGTLRTEPEADFNPLAGEDSVAPFVLTRAISSGKGTETDSATEVGDNVGEAVGETVGDMVGEVVGEFVGEDEGEDVGDDVAGGGSRSIVVENDTTLVVSPTGHFFSNVLQYVIIRSG